MLSKEKRKMRRIAVKYNEKNIRRKTVKEKGKMRRIAVKCSDKHKEKEQ